MNATAQMLSALLGCSQATFASKIELDQDKAIVTREVDGGLQVINISAKFDNGILNVIIPKKEVVETKSKKVKIL